MKNKIMLYYHSEGPNAWFFKLFLMVVQKGNLKTFFFNNLKHLEKLRKCTVESELTKKNLKLNILI